MTADSCGIELLPDLSTDTGKHASQLQSVGFANMLVNRKTNTLETCCYR